MTLTKTKLTLAVLLAVAVTASIAFVLSSDGSSEHGPTVAAHPSPDSAGGQMRTLMLVEGDEPEPSKPDSVMHGLLTGGKVPREATVATVLTDENCQPDAQGISHCTNRLKLPEGGKLVVTHPHNMSEVPCMTPGEKVRVVAQTRSN